MGFGSRASLAAILGFAAAFVVACGSSGNGLLSSDQSSSIASQLTSVSAAVRTHDCATARAASRRLANVISELPSSVDQKLFRNLGQGAATVSELAEQQCTATQSSSTASVSSSTSSTATQPTTTQAAPTTTQSTSPTTSTLVTSTTSPPSTATNGGGTGTSGNTTAGGGAPVGGQTKTSG